MLNIPAALCRPLRRIYPIWADAILNDWTQEYSAYFITAGSETNPVYLSEAEGIQELFKAVLTGMEFTQAQRLGRPMGSFERPAAQPR